MEAVEFRRTSVPATFFVKVLGPFAIPIVLTLALVVVAGEHWPRTIAPGSGLKLAGFCVTAATSLMVWRAVVRGVGDSRARKFAALACAVTGLMGWPVWSAGFLPSVNGFTLGAESSVRMTLERTEVTSKSKSRDRYHWAWLSLDGRAAPIASGRYFIPEKVYADWSKRRPSQVEVRVARGLLGAVVVTGYQ